MAGKVVVDTNVISYVFTEHSLASPYTRLLRDFDYFIISFQTLAELDVWSQNPSWGSPRKAQLSSLLNSYSVVYPDRNACTLWAMIKRQRDRIGRPIHPEDAWIAAAALALNCPVLTHNVPDFSNIDGLQIITANAPCA